MDLALAQETVSDIIKELLPLFISPRILGKYVKFPRTREEAQVFIDRNTRRGTRLPNTVGFVDGSLIRIQKPPLEENRQAYIGRKGLSCLNVQFVGDRRLYIMNINAKFPGATHDQHIFTTSPVKTRMAQFCQERECWLLGDSGYTQEPFMMTPFARHLEPAPHTPGSRYNMIQSSDRNAIERLIGVFKMRWRCTHADNVLRYNPPKCGQIITACAVLHNLCILGGVQDYIDAEGRGNNLCRGEHAEPGEQFLEGGAAARQRLVNVLDNM